MKSQLSEENCYKCKKSILVARYQPNPDNEKATGMPCRAWDGSEDYFVGWICEPCAQKLYDEKKAGYSGGGYLGDFECFLTEVRG